MLVYTVRKLKYRVCGLINIFHEAW